MTKLSGSVPGSVHAPSPAQNRRRFPRRSKPFQGVWYTPPGQKIPTVGLDISGGGLCMITQEPIADTTGDMTVAVLIDDKPLTVVTRVLWQNTMPHRGKTHYRYGLRISTIADADWDRLMHWTLQQGDSNISEGSILSASDRDRLLTIKNQRAIADSLIAKKRLDPIDGTRLPLIEYSFQQYTMRLGVPYMLFKVRSKRNDPVEHVVNEFRTELLVPVEEGQVRVLN